MSQVFVDTSAWCAIIDASDAEHEGAAAALADLARTRARLVTSGHVLAELHRLILHRSHPKAALEAVRRIRDTPRSEFVHADDDDLSAAVGLLEHYADQDLTLTDAVSFAVMRRMGIRRAFAYDHDFAIAGFELIGS